MGRRNGVWTSYRRPWRQLDIRAYLTVKEFEVLFGAMFAQIVAFTDGAPVNVVNPEVLGERR
jgi:hypothetical protein